MSALAGTGRLLALQLRAAWRGLTFWLLAAAGAVVVTAWSITALYPGQEQGGLRRGRRRFPHDGHLQRPRL